MDVVQTRLVAVADRTPVFLLGLAGVLTDMGCDVLTGTSGAEARDLLGKSPDVLLLDLRLLTADPALGAAVRERGVPLVVSVAPECADEAMTVVADGVAGLWDRDGDAGELRRIVAGALNGATLISADVGAAILERIAAASTALRGVGAGLTAREKEILHLMAEGAGNRAIADTLVISENTVRNHVRSVLDKLQAQSRTEAVVRALKAGLVRLG